MGDALATVDLGAGRRVVALSSGGAQNCVILDQGSVKCWGYNDVGQLGQGDTRFRGALPDDMGDHLQPIDLGSGRTARAVCTRGQYSCALLDNGVVKCWGAIAIGVGDDRWRGSEPGQMGDALPAVDLRF